MNWKDMLLNLVGGLIVIVGMLLAVVTYELTGSILALLGITVLAIFTSGFAFIQTSDNKKDLERHGKARL